MDTIETTTLTLEQHLAKAADIKAQLEELTRISARAYTDPNFEPSYSAIQDECEKKVEKFNWHSMTAEFLTCAASPDPLFAIVERFSYLTASVKEKTDDAGGGAVHFLELTIGQKQCDLLKFNTFVGGNIGHGDWISAIQQLGLRLTMKAAASIGIPAEDIQKIDDSYNMTKLAREVQLAKADETGSTPDPVSKNQMVKTLDLILELMLGEGYHCDTRDVAFLMGCFTRKGRKALTLKTANNKELTGLVHQIAHRVALGKAYSIDAYTKKAR